MTEKEAVDLLLGKTDEDRYGPQIMEALRNRKYRISKGRVEIHGGPLETIFIFVFRDREREIAE